MSTDDRIAFEEKYIDFLLEQGFVKMSFHTEYLTYQFGVDTSIRTFSASRVVNDAVGRTINVYPVEGIV